MIYRIVGTTPNETCPETGERLYWSDQDGWVARASASIYESRARSLPIGGAWEPDQIEPPRPTTTYDLPQYLLAKYTGASGASPSEVRMAMRDNAGDTLLAYVLREARDIWAETGVLVEGVPVLRDRLAMARQDIENMIEALDALVPPP